MAGALTPHYSWRIMWLIGRPAGLLFIALSHWIPESPRYLLAAGGAGLAAGMTKLGGVLIIAAGIAAPASQPD